MLTPVSAGGSAGLGRGSLEGPGPLHDIPGLAAGSAHPVSGPGPTSLNSLTLQEPLVRMINLPRLGLGHLGGCGLLKSILESFDGVWCLSVCVARCGPHHSPALLRLTARDPAPSVGAGCFCFVLLKC